MNKNNDIFNILLENTLRNSTENNDFSDGYISLVLEIILAVLQQNKK